MRHKSHTLLSPFSLFNGIFCANSLNHITSSWTRTYSIRTHKLIYALLLINWIIIKWYYESHIPSYAQQQPKKRIKIFDQFNVTLKPVDDEHWNFFRVELGTIIENWFKEGWKFFFCFFFSFQFFSVLFFNFHISSLILYLNKRLSFRI